MPNLNKRENSSNGICNKDDQSAEKIRQNSQKESLESRILVIYTGGTIGMIINKEGGKFDKRYHYRDNLLFLIYEQRSKMDGFVGMALAFKTRDLL